MGEPQVAAPCTVVALEPEVLEERRDQARRVRPSPALMVPVRSSPAPLEGVEAMKNEDVEAMLDVADADEHVVDRLREVG
jgi:hypothetical protein